MSDVFYLKVFKWKSVFCKVRGAETFILSFPELSEVLSWFPLAARAIGAARKGKHFFF